MNFSAKLTAKIIIKSDYVRADGTSALFIQIFLNKVQKRIPLNISAPITDFDKIKQRLKPKAKFSNDYNLIIEKSLSDINKIEINYRLLNVPLTIEKLLNDYENPTSRLDFCNFWKIEMENQKGKIKDSTYKQQMSMFRKLKKYKNTVYFYEINEEFIEKIKKHFKVTLKNEENTIQTFIKSFKKYLHLANRRGIITPIMHDDIKRKEFTSNRAFLIPEEIIRLHNHYKSAEINATHKAILARFLFSCFTGLRISDIQKLTIDNFQENMLFFVAQKTNKIQKIKMNLTAMSLIDPEVIFYGKFSDQYVNRELKLIAMACSINKNLTYHVSRHTFATNYIMSGGNVVTLQKLLGHSKITETMIYVKIADSMQETEILLMDSILNIKKPLS